MIDFKTPTLCDKAWVDEIVRRENSPSADYNFGNIYMITQGGPARTDNQFAGYTDILASTTYKMSTTMNRYELSATFSVLIFLIVGSMTLLNMHMSGSFKEVD